MTINIHRLTRINTRKKINARTRITHDFEWHAPFSALFAESSIEPFPKKISLTITKRSYRLIAKTIDEKWICTGKMGGDARWIYANNPNEIFIKFLKQFAGDQ